MHRCPQVVVPAITCTGMHSGRAAGKFHPATAAGRGVDTVLIWDRAAVDATTEIKVALRLAGTPIGPNDTAIAGHAIAAGAVLMTNNTREFARVPGLVQEDWVK